MRKSMLPSLVLSALTLIGALAVPALSAQPKTVNVKIGESPHFFFVKPSPAVPTVTVRKGDRVRWRWCPDTHGCGSEHNVVGSRDGKVRFKIPRTATDSSGLTSGSHARTFTTPGTYHVICTIHDFAMKVNVRE